MSFQGHKLLETDERTHDSQLFMIEVAARSLAQRLFNEARRKARVGYEAYVVDGICSHRVLLPYLFFCARIILKLKRPKIIGITGSVGKSTMTEVLCSALTHPDARALIGRVGKTTNNLNNYDGLPLVVLRFQKWYKTPLEIAWLMLRLPFRTLRLAVWPNYPKVLVLEFGTDRSGYLKPLVRLAPPDIAIITAIGPAHLQGMGSMQGVVREKAALLEGEPPPRLAIFGEDHPYIEQLEKFARSASVRVPGRGVDLAGRIARVVGERLGLPETVYGALSEVTGPDRRLQQIQLGRIQIIDDSYNANPLSMKLGLDTLASGTPNGHRRVAIIGTMAELGADSATYHAEIGAYARLCSDVVVGVGDMATSYNADHWFSDSDECADAIAGILQEGDHVLVKGSASVCMDKIVQRIAQSWS